MCYPGVKVLLFVLVAFAVGAAPASAQVGRGVFRGLLRNGERAAERSIARVLARDAARDAGSAARRLAAPRKVFRYTTPSRARLELKRGIAPGSHMTARSGPGRPLAGSTAQRRFGLPGRAGVRESILLPRGTPVRVNKALGGAPGMGEVTSTRRIPGSAIQRILRLP
jgi:hypothetical protein